VLSGPNAFIAGAGRGNGVPVAADPVMPILVIAFTAIITVVAIWQFVILCKAVGEAHEFSAWRGLGTWMLAGLAMVAFAFAILILIGIFVGIIAANVA
jgi:ABC-type proline/glycine betaine transport system permease subunit